MDKSYLEIDPEDSGYHQDKTMFYVDPNNNSSLSMKEKQFLELFFVPVNCDNTYQCLICVLIRVNQCKDVLHTDKHLPRLARLVYARAKWASQGGQIRTRIHTDEISTVTLFDN